jgi:hypothetical protein
MNVKTLNLAVSDRTCEADLMIAQKERAGHNTLGAFGYDTTLQCRERVQVECLDTIVEREHLRRVDVLKIDIEGAELSALMGCRQTLQRFRPMMLVELSDRTLQHQNSSSKRVWEFLVGQGYRLYQFDNCSGRPVDAEEKPFFDGENILAAHSSVCLPNFTPAKEFHRLISGRVVNFSAASN